jgi:hypothetical protein
MSTTPALRMLVGLLVLLASAGAASAQRAYPRIGLVYPAGGQKGTTVVVSVAGQNLNETVAAYFSGYGLEAKVTGYERPLTQRELNDLREKADQLQQKRTEARTDPIKPFTAEDEKQLGEIRQTIATRGNRQATPAVAETVTLAVTIPADAELGERELRLRTAIGLSNPFTFSIGDLPETSAPIVTAISSRPAPGARPASLRDPRGATEVTLPTILNGQILPGESDRFQFQARRGTRFVAVVRARALNPYLADAVPGWFQATLALYDATGREIAYADDFRFNPDPVITCEIPQDGRYTLEIKDAIHRGREDFVYRITLGEVPFVSAVFPLGAPVATRPSLELSGSNLPTDHLEIASAEQVSGQLHLRIRNDGVLSNPVSLAFDTQPEILAAEPNESAADAQRVGWPTIVNGRVDRPGDIDVFSFEGRAGSVITAEVIARRLGSPLDSVLTLTDAEGRILATNDDYEDKAAALLTHHADSYLRCRLPNDGVYLVHLRDAQNHGGPEYAYRLRIAPALPDFALRVVPSTLNLRAGTCVPITVHALRRDGYSGEIALRLVGAPPGFVLSGARIPANQDRIQLTLTAPPAPRDEPYTLVLAGSAAIGGATLNRVAAPADDMMQAFANHHLVPAREWKVQVTGRGPAFRPATREVVVIPLGGSARVTIALPAGAPQMEYQLELAEPIAGVSVQTKQDSRGTVDVVLSCDASRAQAGMEGNVHLNVFGRRLDPKGKTAPRALLGSVPAILFVIPPRDNHGAS